MSRSKAGTTSGGSAPHNVRLNLGPRSYDIVVRRGSLCTLGDALAKVLGETAGRVAMVVSNPKVDLYHGRVVQQSLADAGMTVIPMMIPAGESYKSLQTVRRVYKALNASKVDRRGVIVALGGGVIGDVAGFAAATYLRGLDYVQIPTTLLAQVDSSVGGKTGVNFDNGKNLIGSFYQPRFVLIDPDTLRTLPIRERRSGLAEIIKYGIIYDKEFFHLLEREAAGLLRLTSDRLEYAISHSCEIKARVVEQDERDEGLRAILNFGHTIGHALESITHYRVYRHGEAIAAGMVSAALIGEEMGITSKEDTEALIRIFGDSGFSVNLDSSIAIGGVMRLLSWDKKAVEGTARFVLMERIGKVSHGHQVPPDVIRTALERQQLL
ncbi:MAG: 3-dehydroquinate synthase [Capsulimonadaceae bacterium]